MIAPARSNQQLVAGIELPPERRYTQAEPSAALSVRLDRYERRVSVGGELDLATVPLLTDMLAMLRDLDPGGSVIDIAGVSFIDAAGLSCLLIHAQLIAELGAKTSIVGATPRTRRIFDIVGMSDLLEPS